MRRITETFWNGGILTQDRIAVLMKKARLVITYVLIITPILQARSSRPLSNWNKSGLNARSIEQVLTLPEGQVDLATAVLIVSEQWSDMVYGRKYLERLDNMALEIRERIRQNKLPFNFKAIPIINDYLFNELGFEALTEATDPNSLFLHTVLDKKKGYCLSLSVLYLSIAERLDMPVYGVVVPGHFFVRYDDGRRRFNIETTSGGGTAPDENYIEKFNVPSNRTDSVYMKNLNKIQTLGCFFNNLGNSYSEVGNMKSAQLALERSVQINPTLSESRANLGNIYLQQNRVSDAIKEYKYALQINPNDSKTHNGLGNAYSEKDWNSYAVSEYKEAIRLDPNFVEAYKNLAFTYRKQEMFNLAIMQLRQALILKPEDTDCYTQIGDLFRQMEHYQQAILEYTKALRIDSEFIDAHYGLALCYNKEGRTNDEISQYQRILALKPDMYTALFNLGNVYFEQEKYNEAIEQYNKAVQIEPHEAMIYYNIGAAYSNKSDYENAVAAYLKVIEIDPSVGDAHYRLAYSYYQLRKYDLSWKHIKKAQELGIEIPDDLLEAIKSQM